MKTTYTFRMALSLAACVLALTAGESLAAAAAAAASSGGAAAAAASSAAAAAAGGAAAAAASSSSSSSSSARAVARARGKAAAVSDRGWSRDTGTARIYQKRGFQGQYRTLEPGKYHAKDLHIKKGEPFSLRVGKGYKVSVFSQDKLLSQPMTFTEDFDQIALDADGTDFLIVVEKILHPAPQANTLPIPTKLPKPEVKIGF